MKKISTLYKKNPENLGRVINEVDPKNEWVINGEGVATRKFDGTATAIINGVFYKRYDVKNGRAIPDGAISCQDADPITGHWPHWVQPNPMTDKHFFEAFNALVDKSDGTYELCGPKVNKNREGFFSHVLVRHGAEVLSPTRTWDGLIDFLINNDIEGIVFHHSDGRMCKIRKSDFGIKR